MPISRLIRSARGSLLGCRCNVADLRESVTLHATSVAVAGRAALIRGASGSGKSALALQLMALGAVLVADDRTCVTRASDHLLLDAPDAIRGMIEARGVGILNAPTAGPVPAALIVDMDGGIAPRLPADEQASLLGLSLPLVRGSAAAHFPAALYLYLLHGRSA